ncbi:MAG: PD-(D/E)XK nuclease family protein [Planctomycetia bacterium]|nr:PD-(D/E)XK nuclease family protein [Planctomycetia bacterium]
MASPTNLFGSLFRWAHRQDENFLTESLVCVLNLLIEQERDLARDILHWLLDAPTTAQWFNDGEIDVATQFSTEEGRPDIRIKTASLLAFVEVKKETGLGALQLDRYRRALTSRANGRDTRLVLLTRYPIAFGEEQDRPDAWRRWHEVADKLARCQIRSPVAVFVTTQFVAFLEAQSMAVEQVNWQFLDGYRAFRNLVSMLGTAIEMAQIPDVVRSAAWDYTGYYVDKKRFWIGLMHDRHSTVWFQVLDKTIDMGRLRQVCQVQTEGDRHFVELDLSSEAAHFFARSKESQLVLLTDFARSTYVAARQSLPENPPVVQP